MQRGRWILAIAMLWTAPLGCMGCSKSDSAATDAGATAAREQKGPASGPDVAVFDFLKAVQTGDEAKAALMLTQVARQKTAEMDLVVSPPGSPTASFEVGEVEMIKDDGAYVASTWTDVDPDGKSNSDQIVWVVRREPEGWRIAGMVTTLFNNKLVLNFEDPQDMLRKQQLAEEEMQRRAVEGTQQAQQVDPVGGAIRR